MRFVAALVLLLSPALHGQTSKVGMTDPPGRLETGTLTVKDIDADEPPILTQVQRLQLEKAILVFQNTQLRLQLAQDDHTRSRLELQDVFKGLPTKEGWQFDLQKFAYVKVEPAAPAGAAPK